MRDLDNLVLFIIECNDLESLHLGHIILDLFMLSHFLNEKVVNHCDQLHVSGKNSRKQVYIPVHAEFLNGPRGNH